MVNLRPCHSQMLSFYICRHIDVIFWLYIFGVSYEQILNNYNILTKVKQNNNPRVPCIVQT